MKIKTAIFHTSVTNKKDILNLNLPEFAFVGRSNCGKSSLINSLCNQNKLAKTSSTPGLTKFINYFLINCSKDFKVVDEDSFILIDLPGYGFSKTGKDKQEFWSDLIGSYFEISQNLKCVYVLVDIRHEPSILDRQMVMYLYSKNIPFKIIATKSDKLAKSKIINNVRMIANFFKVAENNIIFVSAENKTNLNLIIESFQNFISMK